jgi:hypothetical protein
MKSLARDAGNYAPKGDFCVREFSSGVRADGFIALADEDPSKDLIIDVLGSDPSNISFIRASSNILSLRKPSRMPLTGASSMVTMPLYSILASPSSVPSVPISVLCSIALHKQSTTTRRTHIPALGNITLISGPSHAYLWLPPHSPKLGTCLLSLTMLTMPNATICKMYYKHLPPPRNHLVFTMLV